MVDFAAENDDCTIRADGVGDAERVEHAALRRPADLLRELDDFGFGEDHFGYSLTRKSSGHSHIAPPLRLPRRTRTSAPWYSSLKPWMLSSISIGSMSGHASGSQPSKPA